MQVLNKIMALAAIAGFLGISLDANLAKAQSEVGVGRHECGPYDSRDTRPQPPPTDLTDVFLDTRGYGYVLAVVFDNERGAHEILLNSELHLLTDRAVPYTMEPLQISSNGQFSITILGRSSVCTYSGVARISPQAASRLSLTTNSSISSVCNQAVSNVKQRLQKVKGVVILDTELVRETNYPDAPTERPNSLIFGLENNQGGVNVMNSPIFSNSIASEIISECNSIGIVSLGLDSTDWIRSYGIVGNEVTPFKCLRPGRNNNTWRYIDDQGNRFTGIPWGYNVCL
jgi:hypothetical protein